MGKQKAADPAGAEAQGGEGSNGTTTPVKKTECPMSAVDFLASAQPLVCNVGGQTKVLEAREFSSGSFGWYSSDKITVMVDGKPVKCQANISLVVVGSKPK